MQSVPGVKTEGLSVHTTCRSDVMKLVSMMLFALRVPAIN